METIHGSHDRKGSRPPPSRQRVPRLPIGRLGKARLPPHRQRTWSDSHPTGRSCQLSTGLPKRSEHLMKRPIYSSGKHDTHVLVPTDTLDEILESIWEWAFADFLATPATEPDEHLFHSIVRLDSALHGSPWKRAGNTSKHGGASRSTNRRPRRRSRS